MRSWRGRGSFAPATALRAVPLPRAEAQGRAAAPILPRGAGEGDHAKGVVEGASCRRGPAMVGWPAMKPAPALRLLHWAVLAFVLIGLGPAWAQDVHPLDLDQTRAALSSTESALRDKNLTDADLLKLKAENDAL